MAVAPTSGGLPRGRLLVAVAVAVAVAGIVVALALLATGGDEPKASPAATRAATTKPLPGVPQLVVELPADAPSDPAERVAWARDRVAAEPGAEAALLLAAAESAAGDRAAATAALAGVETPDADAARALLAYDRDAPEPAIAALARLHDAEPDNGLIGFAYGAALLWSGQRARGEDVLRAVRDAAPESFHGIAADNLVHPSAPPGYPPFVTAVPVPDRPLAALLAAARAAPADAQAQIDAGAALLAAGRRLDAADAFDAALQADPSALEAKVGRIIATYGKDHPERSFGQMGPLVRDNPSDPSPRLHLALMLLWIKDLDTARAELRQVANADPNGRLGAVAQRFLDSL